MTPNQKPSIVDEKGNTFNGLVLPRFNPGTGGPQISSSGDMNRLVDAVNSISSMRIHRGVPERVIISDGNTLLQVKPSSELAAISANKKRLAAYWTLDETSGNRVDKVSGIPLIPGGTEPIPFYATGIYSNGLYFDYSVESTFSWATTQKPNLANGGKGFALFGWHNFISNAITSTGVEMKWEFFDAAHSSVGYISLTIGNSANGNDTFFRYVDSLGAADHIIGAPSLNHFHFFMILYDSSTSKLQLNVDDLFHPFFPGTPTFNAAQYGALTVSVSSAGTNQKVIWDEVGVIVGKPPTSTEQTALYNSGSGVTWPAVRNIFT